MHSLFNSLNPECLHEQLYWLIFSFIEIYYRKYITAYFIKFHCKKLYASERTNTKL